MKRANYCTVKRRNSEHEVHEVESRWNSRRATGRRSKSSDGDFLTSCCILEVGVLVRDALCCCVAELWMTFLFSAIAQSHFVQLVRCLLLACLAEQNYFCRLCSARRLDSFGTLRMSTKVVWLSEHLQQLRCATAVRSILFMHVLDGLPTTLWWLHSSAPLLSVSFHSRPMAGLRVGC